MYTYFHMNTYTCIYYAEIRMYLRKRDYCVIVYLTSVDTRLSSSYRL